MDINFFWCGGPPPYHVWSQLRNWKEHLHNSGSDIGVCLWVDKACYEDAQKVRLYSFWKREINIRKFSVEDLTRDMRHIARLYKLYLYYHMYQMASEVAKLLILNQVGAPGIYIDVDIGPNHEYFPNVEYFSNLQHDESFLHPYMLGMGKEGGEILLENWIIILLQDSISRELLLFLNDDIFKNWATIEKKVQKYRRFWNSDVVKEINRNPFGGQNLVRAFKKHRQMKYSKHLMHKMDEIGDLSYVYNALLDFLFSKNKHYDNSYPSYYKKIDFFSFLQSKNPSYTWLDPGYATLCNYARAVSVVERCYPNPRKPLLDYVYKLRNTSIIKNKEQKLEAANWALYVLRETDPVKRNLALFHGRSNHLTILKNRELYNAIRESKGGPQLLESFDPPMVLIRDL